MRHDEADAAGDAPATGAGGGGAGGAAVATAATPSAAEITRRSGKVAALCDLLKKGQRVLLTLTLSCSAPGFSFKALSVEPLAELPPAPALAPASEGTSGSSPAAAAPSPAPTSKAAGKKARKKAAAAAEAMGQAASEHGGHSGSAHSSPRTGSHVCPPQSVHSGPTSGSHSGTNSGPYSESHAGSYLDPQTGYSTGPLRGPRKGAEVEVNGSADLEYLRHEPFRDAFETAQIFNRALTPELETHGIEVGVTPGADSVFTLGEKNYWSTHVIPSLTDLNRDMNETFISCGSTLFYRSPRSVLNDFMESEVSHEVTNEENDENVVCKEYADSDSVKTSNSDDLDPNENTEVALGTKKRKRYHKKIKALVVNEMQLELTESTNSVDRVVLPSDCDIESNKNTPDEVNKSVYPISGERKIDNVINFDNVPNSLDTVVLPKNSDSMFISEDAMSVPEVPASAELNDTKLGSHLDHSPLSASITTTSIQSSGSDYVSCESISKSVEDNHLEQNLITFTIDNSETSPLTENHFQEEDNSPKCSCINTPVMVTSCSSVCDRLKEVSFITDNLLANSTSKSGQPALSLGEINPTAKLNVDAISLVPPPCEDVGNNIASSTFQSCGPSSVNDVHPISSLKETQTSDIIVTVSPKINELLGPFSARVSRVFPRSGVASFYLNGVSTCAFFFFKDVNYIALKVGARVVLENLLRVKSCANTDVYGTTLHAQTVSLVPSKATESVIDKINSSESVVCPNVSLSNDLKSVAVQQGDISCNKNVPVSSNNIITISSEKKVESYIPVNVNQAKDSLPVCAMPMKSTDEELIGPYFATIVETFPKSAVASLLLNGTTKRVFFFLKNVLDGFIPPIGTNVIVKDVSIKFTDDHQFVSTYGTKLYAEIVSVVLSQEAISGRTGCIVKYVAKNCGVLELNLRNEKIHGKFTTAQVTRIDLGKKTLKEVWPVSSIVHFKGELVKTKVKKEFIVTSVWPQGGLPEPIPTKSKNVKPPTKVTKSATKIKDIFAHTGRVSMYVSDDKGVIDFRLGDLYLKADFQSSLCIGLCTEKSLSEQWPPGTIVHFDGVLTRSLNDSTFCVLSVWSKKQRIQTSITKAVSELPRASQITGPHVGQIIELRLPGAFVVSLSLSGQMVKVFVLSMYFRKSIKDPQFKKMVSVAELVYIGQRIVVSMKPSSPDNKKDCDYVATDAWPETEVLSISSPILTAEPLNKISPSINGLNENSKRDYANVPTDHVQTLLPPQSEISFKSKSSALNGTCPDSGTVEQSSNPELSNGEPRNSEPTSIVKQLGLPSSAAKALTARLGPPRLACVVRTTGEAVLFRVKTPGMTVQAAAMAPDIQLCGVPLDGIDLTLVLAPGQELDVYLLPEDEKHILNTDKCSTSNATLAWQNHFYVSVLWLGRAHLETSSMQFAELTNFCLAHKVPNTIRHKLTHRLGQILEKDGRKKIVHSSDEDDYGEAVENQKKKTVKKKTDSKATPQLSDPSIEKAVVEKLKDLGPENFLRFQLKQLIHSVLKESVHAAQEFFLTSLKEYCGSTPVYDILLAETPDIVESAIQEYFLEKQKKAQVEGSLRYSATPAQPANGAGDACADGVSVGAQTARAAAAVAARAVASCISTSATPPRVAPAVAPSVARSLENAKVVVERSGEWGDGGVDGECGSKVREAAAAPEAACRLLHGVKEVFQHPKEGLQATAHVPHSAMQEPVRKQSQIDVADKLAVERSSGTAVSESPVEEQKSPVLDTAETDVTGEPDKRDYQKTLSAELQKHARELALFRDEACSLIENWKSADSPPATPEELEFLQELSLLLDNRIESGGKTGKNEEDTSVAQQLIKFWNTANFPLTPVAQRGLQRLQELFGVPDKKMEGSEKDCLGSSGDGLVEVEAALKEVRDAFRDVKHVFEVQRCFRDLRECFRDVRRAYRGREPRPRALPPCADAPAAAAAAAALAEAVVQVKKRGRNIPGVTSSRTPSPTQTSPQAQSRKKAQLQCSTCKAGILSGASGEDGSTPTNDTTSQRITAEKSKIEVSSKSSQTTASMDTTGDSLPATLDQSAQTISTGAVLALHLLPDQ